VVRHQAIAPDAQTAGLGVLTKNRQICQPIIVGFEYSSTGVAALCHMVRRFQHFDPGEACHKRDSANPDPQLSKELENVPSVPGFTGG
jgi:hypothetical protein